MSTDKKLDAYLADNPIEARPVIPRPEPSPRMRELDFLLGTVESIFDTGVRFVCTTKPILGGLHVQMEISATYADGSWRNFETTVTNLLHDPAESRPNAPDDDPPAGTLQARLRSAWEWLTAPR